MMARPFKKGPGPWILVAALALVILLCAPETPFARADPSGPLALVRIDVREAADLESVIASEVPVHARLYGDDGTEYLLAYVDPSQAQELASRGVTTRVLDPDPRGATYYVVYSHGPMEPLLGSLGVLILEQEEHRAVVRATNGEAERLLAVGLEIVRLDPNPLVLAPQEARVSHASGIVHDPLIEAMIQEVNAATVYSYTGGLSGEWPVIVGGVPYTIATRYSRTTTPVMQATQYVHEHLVSLGLGVSYHEYSLPNSGLKRNVIGEQVGLVDPDRILLITAHLDDTSEDAYNVAPGADDNASGAVGVLIAADILSQYDFGCTLRYVLFTGEEQGLYGSAAYAADAYSAGENVEGVLNLDMIGYNSDSEPTIELHTRPGNGGDLSIAHVFSDVVATYGIDLWPEIVGDGILFSDHASFWNRGYAGILGIEDFEDFTPHYHRTSDRLSTLDMTYYANFVRAGVGTFAHLGCLMEPAASLTGMAFDIDTGTPISGTLVRATLSSTQTWSTVAAADGVYHLDPLPGGTYTVTASAPAYLPYTASDVVAVAGKTTTLDIPLQAVPAMTASFVSSSPDWLGEVTVFTNTTDSAEPLTYEWSLGDGTGIVSAEHPTHTYEAPGVYTVILTATDSGGSAAAKGTVTVYGAPVVGFEHVHPVWAGATTLFTNTSVGEPAGDPGISFEWSFGDGTAPEAMVHAEHVYTAAGVYQVVLTGTNRAGSRTAQRDVRVETAGVALLPRAESQSGDPGTAVSYTLRVSNTGSYTDSYAIAAQESTWVAAVVPHVLHEVGPAEGRDVEVRVMVPGGALAGEEDAAQVRVQSQGNGSMQALSVLTTTARAVYGIDLTFPAGALSGVPGAGVTCTLRITNTGNVTDTLSLAAYGHQWPTFVRSHVGPLGPGSGSDVEVTVLVPMGAERGDADVATISAVSEGDPERAVAGSLKTMVYYRLLMPTMYAALRSWSR